MGALEVLMHIRPRIAFSFLVLGLLLMFGVLAGPAHAANGGACSVASAVAVGDAHAFPDLIELAVDYGTPVLGWLLALIAAGGGWLVVRLGLAARWRELVKELGAHARDVVLEVWQTYVEAIKAGRADGRLTEEEKRQARDLAMKKLRERLGWKKLLALGGGLFARVFAGEKWAARVEEWLGGAIETAVAEAKREGKALGLRTSGTRSEPAADPR